MKCEYSDCENEINKSDCFITGVNENRTYWCSRKCYLKHIRASPEEIANENN